MDPRTNQILRAYGFADGGRLNEPLTSKIRRADIFLSHAFHQVTAAHDLKSGAISALALIIANPGISQNELAEQIGKDKSRVVAIVDALEQRGFAQRSQSAADRRKRTLFATPEGDAFLNRLIEEVKETERQMLALVPQEDLDTLEVLLERIVASCAREGSPFRLGESLRIGATF